MNHLKSLGVAVALIFSLGGCDSQQPTASYLPQVAHDMAAQDYVVTRIEVSGADLCVFTDDDVLLVFSEEVTATPKLDGIVAEGVVYPMGVAFRALQAQEISDGFMCGGKRYRALHIPGPGLSVPFLG